MAFITSVRNQVGINYNPDINDLMGLKLKETLANFARLYDGSPMMALLPKRIVRSQIERWPFKDSSNNFIQQARNSSMLWAGFPVPPDTNTYIHEKLWTAESLMYNEMAGFLEYNNEEIEEASYDGLAGIDRLYQNRVDAAMNTLMVDLNGLVYTGQDPNTGNPVGVIRGLENVFSFLDAGGLLTGDDADYIISNIPHGKPSDNTALNGVDYTIKWRPLCARWNDAGSTLTFANGHGQDPDVGGGLNAAGGTAEVPNTQLTGISTLKRALDEFTLEIDQRGHSYEYIVTSPRIAQDYKIEYDETLQREIPNGQISLPELGTRRVATYEGRPIITDRYCPADRMYFINRRGLELLTLKFANVPSGRSITLPGAETANMAIAMGELIWNNLTDYRLGVLVRPSLQYKDSRYFSCLRFS